jgi:nuclear pore complex protein Nup205
MLLLLLWRHIAYYCEGHHINNPDLRASTSYAIRFLSSPDAETFRSEAGIKLTPALQKLSLLDLVGRSYFASQDLGRLTLSQQEDTIGNGWRSNQGYIEIMCRRLRDTAGLHDVPE